MRGTKTRVVSVRIPESVFREVEKQAEARGRLVSGELKSSICLLFEPETVESTLEPVKAGNILEVLEQWRDRTREIIQEVQTFEGREKHSLEVLEYQIKTQKEKLLRQEVANR